MGVMQPGKTAIPILDSFAMNAENGAAEMNRMAASGTPFLFIVDAWAEHWVVMDFPGAASAGISWNIEGRGTLEDSRLPLEPFIFNTRVVSREIYQRGFNIIHKAQINGDSWLANLTFPTDLETDLSLELLASCARAPFRLLAQESIAVFSPERFISIADAGQISSFPMKGTIDASLPNAAEKLLADEKEAAEHVTIVDLIRNDLGMVAGNISVPRYRFLTEVKARDRHLLQLSSQVSGNLGTEWRNTLGATFKRLLPAGSVTGAPKKRTGEIIREAESCNRGWYTGVFGVFDGSSLDSAVMIRFVEKTAEGNLVYKSGGGITIYSDMESEYAELKAKIYAPAG
ncbi:MAG: aminodeoxychorismate synthase component I [Spirochaetaceae bacterium]|nr:aminodeoxychorismate synthase component I [Spirochaetaceae bacterium]